MRILFMGTPQFAAISLEKLIESGLNIIGVVTQPDRPRGRGMQLQPSEVKSVALQYNLPVWQPEKVNSPEFLNIFEQLQPSLVVVVAFGQKIPAPILNNPEYGCINLHGSLLPQYRGAAPIQWSILNGDSITGVTTMYMDEGWDTGDMIYQESTPINPNDNLASLYQRLARIGAELLVKTIHDLNNHIAPRIKQEDILATIAPKLPSDLREMDWSLPAETIHNRVRVLSPAPGIETYLNGERIKIIETKLSRMNDTNTEAEPGQILEIVKQIGILVNTGDRPLLITKIQPNGKKTMAATDYANGKHLQQGMFFTEKV